MLTRAHQDGLPLGVVLADAGYGSSSDFRLGVHRLGLPYSVGVVSTSKVFAVHEVVNRGGKAIDLRKLATKLDAKGKFQRFTWRTSPGWDLEKIGGTAGPRTAVALSTSFTPEAVRHGYEVFIGRPPFFRAAVRVAPARIRNPAAKSVGYPRGSTSAPAPEQALQRPGGAMLRPTPPHRGTSP